MQIAVLLTPFILVAGAAPDGGVAPADFGRPGPFPVGVRTVVLVDESRQDAFAGGPRTLVTEVWYPAVEEARGQPPMRFSEFFGRYREEGAKALRADLDALDKRFRTLAVRGAGLRSGGRRPLLIFSHGNGGFRHQNVFQMDHLASHGYIVASPDHTGNSKLSPLPERAVGYDRQGRGQSAADRPRDVRFLIDRLPAADRADISWLSGAVDTERIGVLGHSFGGFTAVRVAEEDVRVKAILPMTVAFVAKPTSLPTLVMLGTEDRTVGGAGNIANRGYFAGCTGPRYLFALKRGGHFTFTEMSQIAADFGDGVGRGKAQSGEVIDFVPEESARALINAYSLAFFERHLRNSEAGARFLEANRDPAELEWWVGEKQVEASAAAPQPPRRERL